MWADVVGYEGLYEVSTSGEVRSLDRLDSRGHQRRGKLLRAFPNWKGYLRLHLHKDGVRKEHRIHRLVLEAFVGPCPIGNEACHNNSNPADNRLENLRWDTGSANTMDSVRLGTHAGFQKGPKVATDQDKVIRFLYQYGNYTQRELGEAFGRSQAAVHRLVTGNVRTA